MQNVYKTTTSTVNTLSPTDFSHFRHEISMKNLRVGLFYSSEKARARTEKSPPDPGPPNSRSQKARPEKARHILSPNLSKPDGLGRAWTKPVKIRARLSSTQNL